jgi:FSR family fosmidomycin resistance protein-like MFS transporter
MTSKGTGLWLAGISLSILQLSGAAGTFLAGTISDRIGRKRAMLIITAANPLLMWLFIASSGIMVIPVLILNGLFLFGSGPVLLALVHDTDSNRMSFINSIYMTLNFILGTLTVLTVGAAADRIGLDLTYRLSAAAAAVAFLFALFLRMPGRVSARG